MKRLVEKVTGYEITVSEQNKQIKRKKSKVQLLIDTELIEKKKLILSRNRSIHENTVHKYKTNLSFNLNVNYTTFYETLEIRDKTILYESFHGKNMSCNPYAIFKRLLDHPDFKDYHHIWVLNDKANCIDKELLKLDNVEFVKVNSQLYLKYLASCKFLINNTSFPPYFIKKTGQIYLNTWHGTPLKTLGKDMQGTIGQHKNLMRNFLQTDYLLAPNRFTANKLIESHDLKGIYQGKIAETGYPRVDLVFQRNEQLKKSLECTDDKKVLLYAPTWRGEVGNVAREVDKFVEDVELMQARLGDQYHILLKVHSLMVKYMKPNMTGVQVVPDNVDVNELLSFVDVLLTDYSSVFFDFLQTRKPIIFYAYDREQYRQERGFYLDLEDMPGPICETIEEVIESIHTSENNKDKYANKFDDSIKEFAQLEDGKSTDRLIDIIFNGDETHTYSITDNKKNILIYCGGFLNNGVTTSALNLFNNIDYDRYNVIVADKGNFTEEDANNFNRINENVKRLYRVGSMNVLLDEVDAQNYLFQYGAEQYFKKGPENYLDQEIITMYQREYRRMFGNMKVDVVIDFSGYVKFWTLLLATSDAKKKLIFQHNEMMEEYEKVVDSKYKHKENLNVIFPLYNYYDHIVSVAKHTRDKNRRELEHLVKNSHEKMVYVHNSINYDYVLNAIHEKNDVTEIANAYEFVDPDRSKYNFVTMGRMSPEKAHKKLIHAFSIYKKSNKDIKLYIIGTGELHGEIEKLIKSYRLENDIYLVGQLANPFPLIHNCDCFVLPSDHEGQPMVLLENLILQKPIVATDIPGNRSVLEDGYGEIVINSVHGLVAGLEKAATEKPTFKTFDYVAYNKDAMDMFYQYVEN